MLLEGSCQCRAVTFRVRSSEPAPYQRCYCAICRKINGSGGFGINIAADARTLETSGREYVSRFHAIVRKPGEPDRRSDAERTFCSVCGAGLWLYDPRWPDLLHPYASAIDTPLPTPSEHTHILLASKAGWAEVQTTPGDRTFDGFPDESIADWHRRTGQTA